MKHLSNDFTLHAEHEINSRKISSTDAIDRYFAYQFFHEKNLKKIEKSLKFTHILINLEISLLEFKFKNKNTDISERQKIIDDLHDFKKEYDSVITVLNEMTSGYIITIDRLSEMRKHLEMKDIEIEDILQAKDLEIQELKDQIEFMEVEKEPEFEF